MTKGKKLKANPYLNREHHTSSKERERSTIISIEFQGASKMSCLAPTAQGYFLPKQEKCYRDPRRGNQRSIYNLNLLKIGSVTAIQKPSYMALLETIILVGRIKPGESRKEMNPPLNALEKIPQKLKKLLDKLISQQN